MNPIDDDEQSWKSFAAKLEAEKREYAFDYPTAEKFLEALEREKKKSTSGFWDQTEQEMLLIYIEISKKWHEDRQGRRDLFGQWPNKAPSSLSKEDILLVLATLPEKDAGFFSEVLSPTKVKDFVESHFEGTEGIGKRLSKEIMRDFASIFKEERGVERTFNPPLRLFLNKATKSVAFTEAKVRNPARNSNNFLDGMVYSKKKGDRKTFGTVAEMKFIKKSGVTPLIQVEESARSAMAQVFHAVGKECGEEEGGPYAFVTVVLRGDTSSLYIKAGCFSIRKRESVIFLDSNFPVDDQRFEPKMREAIFYIRAIHQMIEKIND